MSQSFEFLRRPINVPTFIERWFDQPPVAIKGAASIASKQKSLLRILSIAHHQRLEPARLIANLADEYRGNHSRRLRKLADRIESGASIPLAIEQTPGLLSPSQTLAVQFAHQTGTISPTFEMLISDDVDDPHQDHGDPLLYYIVVAITMVGVISFICVNIFPIFIKMAEEFGLPLNDSMQAFIDTSEWLANYWYWPVGIVGVLLLLWYSPLLQRRFRQSTWFSWLVPRHRANAADVLNLLAVSSAAGRPIQSALSTLGRYHFDPTTRSRLLLARNEIEQGEDVWKALAGVRLLQPNESVGLASLSDGRSRAWAMRRLAEGRLAHGRLVGEFPADVDSSRAGLGTGRDHRVAWVFGTVISD